MRVAGILFICITACQPELGEPPSLVQSPRILAVSSQPAEVTPGAAVTLQLLLATPEGERVATEVDWAFCLAPKPPVDNNIVSDACLGNAVRAIVGRTAQVGAVIPAEACALFGPQLPPTPAGQPPARPRDPDGTGGYYQPVRVRPRAWPGSLGDGPVGFALPRILCGLAGASASTAAAYRDRYQPNHNPQLVSVWVTDDAQALDVSELPRQRTLQVHASWNVNSAERFPIFDPASQVLVERTESLQLAWFATAGRFALVHTDADANAGKGVNEWTTPPTPGPVTIWLVLRDDRGGVHWLSLALTIK